MTSDNTVAQQRAEKAAAAFAAQRKRDRQRNARTGLAVVAVILLIVGVGFLLNKLNDDSDDVTAAAAGGSEYGLVVGDAGAPHTIVIYEDFLCPICGILENTASDRLAELAADGQVQIDFRPIVILDRFGPYSEDAANAFFVVQDEAGSEVAKEFHDLLFEAQPSESGPFPDTDWLVEKAVEAGADEDAVRDGIEQGARADVVQSATEDAIDAGVEGTPTVLLDGKPFRDGSSWEEIANNLVSAVE
ncbi:MAG: DsbA family protein [Nocardioides sp.]